MMPYIYWKELKDGRFGIMAILHESRLQDARLLEAIIENDRM